MKTFKVHMEDYHYDDEIYDEYEAIDFEHAAEKFAHDYYNEDPTDDPHRFEIEVKVTDESGVSKKVAVTAEADIIFYGREE